MTSRFRVEVGLWSLAAVVSALPLTIARTALAQVTPDPAAPPAAPTDPNLAPSQVIPPNTSPAMASPAEMPVGTPPASPAIPPDQSDASGGSPAAAAGPTDAAAPAVLPPQPVAEETTDKKINMGFWLRIGGSAQNPVRQDRMNRLSSNGQVEAHFNGRLRRWLQWTANFVGTYGAGSVDGAGRVALLDLIAQLEPTEALNLWAGRMLVASDRSNFSGPYFMAPWLYPGAFGAGPRQGPFGRNDGATLWGQFAGGVFKYYAGVYNLYGDQRADGQFSAPLFSGRLNLALLNPEPGFYHNSTYYGKDLLAIAVGGQYQKNGTASANPAGGAAADYALFNADVLFELGLGSSGVLDLEGALYKYFGDNETRNLSHFVLASYLTPELAGIGRFQPLVRLQQTMYREIDGGKPDTATAFDGQIGYVVDQFATRFAVGVQHAKDSAGDVANQIYAGIQLMN